MSGGWHEAESVPLKTAVLVWVEGRVAIGTYFGNGWWSLPWAYTRITEKRPTYWRALPDGPADPA